MNIAEYVFSLIRSKKVSKNHKFSWKTIIFPRIWTTTRTYVDCCMNLDASLGMTHTVWVIRSDSYRMTEKLRPSMPSSWSSIWSDCLVETFLELVRKRLSNLMECSEGTYKSFNFFISIISLLESHYKNLIEHRTWTTATLTITHKWHGRSINKTDVVSTPHFELTSYCRENYSYLRAIKRCRMVSRVVIDSYQFLLPIQSTAVYYQYRRNVQ